MCYTSSVYRILGRYSRCHTLKLVLFWVMIDPSYWKQFYYYSLCSVLLKLVFMPFLLYWCYMISVRAVDNEDVATCGVEYCKSGEACDWHMLQQHGNTFKHTLHHRNVAGIDGCAKSSLYQWQYSSTDAFGIRPARKIMFIVQSAK